MVFRKSTPSRPPQVVTVIDRADRSEASKQRNRELEQQAEFQASGLIDPIYPGSFFDSTVAMVVTNMAMKPCPI